MMWAVIYMGHSEVDADKIQTILEHEGLLVKIRKIGREDNKVFEILVPKEEVEDAHEVLSEAIY